MSDSSPASVEAKKDLSPQDSSSATQDKNKRKGLLLAALLLAVSWWIVLIWLATSQANQPILNRIQINQSTDVVVGKVVDLSKGTIEVQRIFRGTLSDGKTIPVLNLIKANAKQGETYLLPLFQFQKDKWDITPFRSPKTGDGVFIIYPTSEKIITDLNSLLETLENQQ